MALIELRSVCKVYEAGGERVAALDEVSLLIEAAEVIAVVGPSGSGKSTLAHVVAGLDKPDSGHVSVAGRPLARSSDRALSRMRNERFGFVFQSFHLQPHQTALENVALPLVLAGVRRRARLARATAALQAVGLGDRLRHRPSQLSGGQRQRVGIARAIVNDPDIVIADEPTGNVDSARSGEIMDLLQRLNIERGLTLLVITHDEAIAARAHRVLEMSDGRLHVREQNGAAARDDRRAG